MKAEIIGDEIKLIAESQEESNYLREWEKNPKIFIWAYRQQEPEEPAPAGRVIEKRPKKFVI